MDHRVVLPWVTSESHGHLRLASGVGPAGPVTDERMGRRPGRDRSARRGLAAAADDRARDRLLDRRRAVGRDRRPAARRHPAGPARGRLAAALLHAAALLARPRGRIGGGRARVEPAVRADGDPRRVVGGAGDLGQHAGGLVRGDPDGVQPVPGAVLAGSADVLAGGAAGDPGDRLLPARLRAGRAEPAARGSRASRSRSRSRSTRTTGRSSSPSARRWRGPCCGSWRPKLAPARAGARRPARLRRRVRAVPAVGADDALPGRPHRRAVVGSARDRLAARRARRPARPDAADRAADLRRRRDPGAAAAPRRPLSDKRPGRRSRW